MIIITISQIIYSHSVLTSEALLRRRRTICAFILLIFLLKSNPHYSDTTHDLLPTCCWLPRGLVTEFSLVHDVTDLSPSETGPWLLRAKLVTYSWASSDLKRSNLIGWCMSCHVIGKCTVEWHDMTCHQLVYSSRDHLDMSRWSREHFSLPQARDFLSTSVKVKGRDFLITSSTLPRELVLRACHKEVSVMWIGPYLPEHWLPAVPSDNIPDANCNSVHEETAVYKNADKVTQTSSQWHSGIQIKERFLHLFDPAINYFSASGNCVGAQCSVSQ